MIKIEGKQNVVDRIKQLVLEFNTTHRNDHFCSLSVGISGNNKGQVTMYHCEVCRETLVFYTMKESKCQ